jgi:competence protein CoiA
MRHIQHSSVGSRRNVSGKSALQYAVVDNERCEAFGRGRGTCPLCSAVMIAKCGPRIMHHWAHTGSRNCDPWWENETSWHREWKNLFPEDCREISHTAPDGEIHRADIKTPTGIVIEVQHSSMTDAERFSRESFYRNLVWILDGGAFRKNFDIFHRLPDPTSKVAQDLVWFKATRQTQAAARGLFWRLSENPKRLKTEMVRVHDVREIEEQVEQAYRGHHQYDWVRPRRTWLDATCPVYIDFGDDFLLKLEIYNDSGLPCICFVSKRKFVHDAMIEESAQAIATRFYPVSSSGG